MSGPHIRRRDLVGMIGVGAALAGMDKLARAEPEPTVMKPSSPDNPKPARVLHISDMHVQAKLQGDKGFAAALDHAAQHAGAIDWVLNTGDCVYEGMRIDRDTTRANWALWHAVMKRHCPWATEHVVGNHDIFGWDEKATGARPSDPDYGKKWAMTELGLSSASRVFDRSGWRFIVLDTILKRDNAFACQVTDADISWLETTLAKTPGTTPVCVVTHAPILSVAAGLYLHRPTNPDGLMTPFFLQCIEAVQLSDIIAASGKVRLCLSGHTHMVERIEYKGTTYLGHGAIAGDKWKKRTQGFGSTYGVLELFPDGRFTSKLMESPWKFPEP